MNTYAIFRVLAVCIVLGVPLLGGYGEAVSKESVWVIRERGMLVVLERMSPPTSRPAVTDVCADMPKLSYVVEWALDWKDSELWVDMDSAYSKVMWRGLWGVRPVEVWGAWSNVGCKELMGWGTVWLAGVHRSVSIWVTVYHVAVSSGESAWGRQVFTDWYVMDDGGPRERLHLVGCKDERFCVFVSSYVPGTVPISLDDGWLQPYLKLGESVYIYGCVPVARAIRRWVEYEVSFACMVSEGRMSSPYGLSRFEGGGEFIVSALATPGISGAPVMVVRDGSVAVVGVVNGGIRGFLTTGYWVSEDLVDRVTSWIDEGRDLFGR